MLLKCRKQLLQQSLSCAHHRIICLLPRKRRYATTAPQDIAILGGGITGLCTAYYLARTPNPPNITVYEAASRIGGWLNSKYVDVPGGKVLFEQGPRSLRPSVPRGLLTAALLDEIGLADQMLFVPKDAPSAQLRWIYYPDRPFSLPNPKDGFMGMMQKLLTEPALEGSLLALAVELLKKGRSVDVEDESVGQFLSRRVGTNVVDNVVSAALHGIYAGDVWQLSAKSLLPQQWHFESEKEAGSIIGGMWQKMGKVSEDDDNLTRHLSEHGDLPRPELAAKLKESSVFTLKEGLQQMVERLELVLRKVDGVKLKPGTKVEQMKLVDGGKKIELTTNDTNPPALYDQVISTIFSKNLSTLCTSPNSSGRSLLPRLAQTHAVTVNVVNLYYSNPNLLPISGFGYLIPRSISFDQNPERALGVVFDSEIVSDQDTVPGTKLTVMLGGHWWDDWSSIPDELESISMAKSILKRHLEIDAEPTAVHFSSQKDCIPQYTVGHSQRMKDTHVDLLRHFKGRLKVTGNSYTGVGVNDCVKAALDISLGVLGTDSRTKTGLESFEKELKFVPVSPKVKGV